MCITNVEKDTIVEEGNFEGKYLKYMNLKKQLNVI
jgi:hypothetical protein